MVFPVADHVRAIRALSHNQESCLDDGHVIAESPIIDTFHVNPPIVPVVLSRMSLA